MGFSASADERVLDVQSTDDIDIELVILALKFRLEVFIANPRFEGFDISAGVCGGSSLPGTG
jgi:hypothetical protein